jgi:hypothetical protein
MTHFNIVIEPQFKEPLMLAGVDESNFYPVDWRGRGALTFSTSSNPLLDVMANAGIFAQLQTSDRQQVAILWASKWRWCSRAKAGIFAQLYGEGPESFEEFVFHYIRLRWDPLEGIEYGEVWWHPAQIDTADELTVNDLSYVDLSFAADEVFSKALKGGVAHVQLVVSALMLAGRWEAAAQLQACWIAREYIKGRGRVAQTDPAKTEPIFRQHSTGEAIDIPF